MPSSSLKWNKVSDWCLESHDLRYYVTKFMLDGKPVYQAIRKPDTSLLVAGDSKLCRTACLKDCEGAENER